MPINGYKHSDEIPLSGQVGAAVRSCAEEGYYTDALIAPLTTVAGLKGLITGGHADQQAGQIPDKRSVDIGEALGDFTDAGIAAANTVAGVANLTSGGSNKDRYQFIE
jgi:hypothetical protein